MRASAVMQTDCKIKNKAFGGKPDVAVFNCTDTMTLILTTRCHAATQHTAHSDMKSLTGMNAGRKRGRKTASWLASAVKMATSSSKALCC